ncbi:hypothetical protein [Agaribacter flavus]|uniref:DUF1449 family protein n=1 Tax=Agaribacter flavus TaxID=1902781 RepID=A0ABV7FU48_9ALTE
MDLFLSYIFSFPVIFFTIPLMIMVVFWIIALMGAVDIEILDGSGEVDSSDSTGSSFLESLGLDGVPLTVAISLIELYGFVFAYLAKKYISPLFDNLISATASGLIIVVAAFVIAIPLAAISSKPLRQFFITHEAVKKSDLIGTLCTVTTQKVTESFGQARTEDGMIYSVRTSPGEEISGGELVVLIDFHKEKDIYIVTTESELMGSHSIQQIN